MKDLKPMTMMNEVNLIQAVDLSQLMNKEPEQKAKQLPKPAGYRILCAIPEVEETIEGSSLIKSSEMMRNEELLTTVLFVVDLGPDCYGDTSRFPTGPYCQRGDFILVRPHAGTRLVIHGKEFRIINDDSVEGVVEDPRGIRRK